MTIKKLNIACGSIFLEDGWVNIDFNPVNKNIIKFNLLEKLPFEDEHFEIIYTSNFIEHIPLEKVNFFLDECFRILKKGGKIRIVTPDFDEMCRAFIKCSDDKDFKKKNFVKTEIIDQLVRKKSGGNLRGLINKYFEENDNNMINFIEKRVGKKNTKITKMTISLMDRIKNKLYSIYVKNICMLLPNSFKNQNLSFANIGENHVWIWDFDDLYEKMKEAKFTNIIKINFNETNINNFTSEYLDINEFGLSRSGNEAMYLEGDKPI